MRKFLLLFCMLYGGVAAAQEFSDSVMVYFRQGHAMLDLSIYGNGVHLNSFVDRLRQLKNDSLYRISRICIIGTASPEGSTSLNNQLATKRAENLLAWIERQVPFKGIPSEIISKGIDWHGLDELVTASEMPYKEDVLDILHNTPEWIVQNGQVVDGRKRQLGILYGGHAWQYMEEHFFPKLRSASFRVVSEIEPLQTLEPILSVIETNLLATEFPAPQISAFPLQTRSATPTSQRKSFYMAVKTNLLYDIALIPNVGAEFYIGKNWTIGGNWMYAWWKNERKHNYWRVYGGDLYIRKYFGEKALEKPLTGHHLGIYGAIVTYDFELGGRGYLGNKWSYHTGIEYGYSLPVAKRLNLDFTLGIGYLGGEYMEYLPIDNHYVWQATKQRHWFGPTKAEVSLVWLIGYGNINKKKGGAR